MGKIMPKLELGGAYEWAPKTVNFCTGCSNNCIYCYGKQNAIRFKQVTEDEWPNMRVRDHDVKKKHKKYGELVMVPSSHDITHENLIESLIVIEKLLEADNNVLIVSKPDPSCIMTICEHFDVFSQQITFRYTIGATDNALLSLWEPGAPTFEERMEALIYSYNKGFTTSVSIEPMIDAENVTELVLAVLPYVTETIWIGKMNYLGRIKTDSAEVQAAVERVRETQTDEQILKIYKALKNNPQVRWKDSIKKVVNRY